MKTSRTMHILFLLSYAAMVLLLIPATKTGVAAAAVLIALGAAWVVCKKPRLKAEKKLFPLLPGLILAAYCAQCFKDRWLAIHRVQALAAALHVPVGTLATAAGCALALCALLFLTLVFQRIDRLLFRLSGKQLVMRDLLACLIAAFISVALPQRMSRVRIFSMGAFNFFCALAFTAAVILVIWCLCGRVRIAVVLGSGLFVLLGTVNAYVYKFRQRMFEPSDFFSAGTAVNVMDNYSLRPAPPNVAVCWMVWFAAMVFLLFLCAKRNNALTGRTRLAVSACCVVSIVLTCMYATKLDVLTWKNDGAIYNGYVLDFVSKFKEAYIAEPEGYGEAAVRQLEAQYPPDAEQAQEAARRPHIIVVMDEAFSDLSVLGEIATDTEVIPFISALKQDAVTGHVLVSVYGGNTSNSEYEFLTGNSMAWLSVNAVPFQQYLVSAAYSMVSYLKSGFGYRCIAMHPFYDSGWNRPAAYAAFGFDECVFLPGFPQQQLVRNYVSDREMFETIAATFEERREEPLFLFTVSMQNHGGYTYSGDNYEQTVRLEGFEGEYPDVEQYLSLIHETDKAVEYLISYFSQVEDEVVIVFFGDHQPRLDDGFYKELGLDGSESLDQQQKRFVAPFFIWANYDIEERQIELTSLNYLSAYVYQTAGLPLPAYGRFLSDMEEAVPAINANGYYSRSAGSFLDHDDAAGEEREWLSGYRILQYNSLFDRKHRSDLFFPVLEQ